MCETVSVVDRRGLDLLRDAAAVWPGRDAEYARSDEWLALLFERSAASMCVVSPKGEFMLVNPALCRMLGMHREELIGMRWQDVTHPDDVQADLDNVETAIDGDTGGFRMVKRFMRADGGVVWGDLITSYVCDDDGNIRNWVSQIIDVTDRVAAQRELAWRASHDILTGLPNRDAVFARLAAEGPPGSRGQAVLFVDLDGFKGVNDRHGHAAGDRVLVAVAGALSQDLGDSAMVARMGGDEFLVVLDDCATLEAADAIARQLVSRVAEVTRAIAQVAGSPVTASIGATLRDEADTPDAVVARSDAAMYAAKTAGRNCVVGIPASGAHRLT